ncbi:MAG: YcnI family protein [Gammaproteobacteria bacterium]
MMHRTIGSALTALALSGALPAVAHVVVDPAQAAAGSYTRLAFGVGHGCRGSATNRIEIGIPEGVLIAKPTPKRGWRLHLTKTKLAAPVAQHGHSQTERVSKIAWSGGPLDDEYYDQFVMLVKMPDATSRILFPVTQTCEQGRSEWRLPPGQRSEDPAVGPAPAVQVIPAEQAK